MFLLEGRTGEEYVFIEDFPTMTPDIERRYRPIQNVTLLDLRTNVAGAAEHFGKAPTGSGIYAIFDSKADCVARRFEYLPRAHLEARG